MSENEGLNKDRLRQFLNNVDQEILNIQAGESRFRAGAIHFEKGGSGVMNRLNMFKKNPTKDNLEQFISLAKQDFGATCGEAFETWSVPIHEELTPEADKKPVERSFENQIKNGFYDMFKAARVSLDQKQVEQIERASWKMAKTFKEENSKEIKSQLAVLVKRLERTRTEVKVPLPTDNDPVQTREIKQKDFRPMTGS